MTYSRRKDHDLLLRTVNNNEICKDTNNDGDEPLDDEDP